MKATLIIKLIKIFMVIFIVVQFIAFIIVKQKFIELEHKNSKLESEITATINTNNILKIRLTTMQNHFRIKKLSELYLQDYKPFKPHQIIEKENI